MGCRNMSVTKMQKNFYFCDFFWTQSRGGAAFSVGPYMLGRFYLIRSAVCIAVIDLKLQQSIIIALGPTDDDFERINNAMQCASFAIRPSQIDSGRSTGFKSSDSRRCIEASRLPAPARIC